MEESVCIGEDVVDTLWSDEVAVVILFNTRLFRSLMVTMVGVEVVTEGVREPAEMKVASVMTVREMRMRDLESVLFMCVNYIK